MDIENIMKTAGVSTGIISALGGLWILIKKFNNKRFHSSCCGKDMDVVVAVNEIEEAEKKSTPHPSPIIRPISEPMNVEKLDLEK
jgi:hypothetical protein